MLSSRQPGPLARVALALSFLCGALLVASAAIQTTPQDFQQPGTQPNGLNTPLEPSGNCAFCHGNYDPEIAPLNTWAGTMMANSTRDPIFHAALAIAEQDAVASGALCLRCHSPNGFLEGNATPTDGSGLSGKDFEGVACNFCHRMVDPVLAPENPAPDAAVLANLAEVPGTSHNGQYVVDPDDNRRGPFDPEVCNVLHPETYESPYHQEALLCGTCHEVSNPAFIRQGGPVPSASDVYVAAVDGQPHPTHSQYDEFPIERTYSEWLNSDFAQGPVEMGGLFGGNKTAVSSCQDCHMPDASGTGCTPIFNPPFRDDMPVHSFLGANSWVPRSIYDLDQTQLLYGPAEISGVPLEIFEATIARNLEFMGNAATVELSGAEGALDVRVINNTGHKLPTGYNEGRRMWLNVRFFDASGALVDERGFYDTATADLSTSDTKVYEMELGLDDAMSVATGLPAEKSFHFVLNNKIFKDNRIPPRGFTNAAFEAVQAQPVGASYADGQYWDDTAYDIPCGAVRAEVRLLHQTTTKEYIEFLRDENTTNQAGQIAYDQWVKFGMSEPTLMKFESIDLAPTLVADVESISASSGGQQALCIQGRPEDAGRLYWVVGSVTGTTPGLVLGGVAIPLQFDAWTNVTLNAPNAGALVNTLGLLGGDGSASATIAIPPSPNLAGVTAWHSVLVIDGAVLVAASNAEALAFTF